MKNIIMMVITFVLAAQAFALSITPIKTLDPTDQNMSSTAFTSSENYIYQRVPQDNYSRIDDVNIYSSSTGALVVSKTVSRDFRLNEVLVLEKLGKIILTANDNQRPDELGSIDVIDLKSGTSGPNIFNTGSDYVAVNESKHEVYVRNSLFGQFTIFDLVTGKSSQIKYHPNDESIILAGETILKIAYENKVQKIYNLTRISDGKKLGTFVSNRALLFEKPNYAFMANRYLWIFNKSGNVFQELIDTQTGKTLLVGNNQTMLSGFSESALVVGILDNVNLTLSQFDATKGTISVLGQLALGQMNFATGFFLFNSNKVRVSTYLKEVTDFTLSTNSKDTTGKLTCDGLLLLSPKGSLALCKGKQSSWWKIH